MAMTGCNSENTGDSKFFGEVITGHAVKFLNSISEKGYGIREDEGITVQLKSGSFFIKSSYICFYRSKNLICVDFTTPMSLEPMKRFLSSYARIIGSPLAVIFAGEKMVVFETMSEEGTPSKILSKIPPPEELWNIRVVERKFDRQIAATYYDLVHCKQSCCKLEEE
jgi:hypothetical protein